MNTEISKALAALKANQAPFALPVMSFGRADLADAGEAFVTACNGVEVQRHIVAAVNSAPVLAAEVERLLPHAGECAALADLHILCADAGIAPGHIVDRVRGLLASTGVDQIDGGWKTMVGNSIGLGSTPRDAIEAVIDAEVHRRLTAARVAVEALPTYREDHIRMQLDIDDIIEINAAVKSVRRAVGLEPLPAALGCRNEPGS